MKTIALFSLAAILSVGAFFSAKAKPNTSRNVTKVYGWGGYAWETDESGRPRVVICPKKSRDLCAIIYSCAGQGEPVVGDVVTVEMQDGSGETMEGKLLEVGEENQSAVLDPETQCSEGGN